MHGCSNKLAERHRRAQATHVLGAGRASLSPAPVPGLYPCSTLADGLQLLAGCLQSLSTEIWALLEKAAPVLGAGFGLAAAESHCCT